MKKVWKYSIPIAKTFEMVMPEGAELLCVQVQEDIPCLWALVEPDAQTRAYRLRLIGTGRSIEETIERYIGTFQVEGGRLVFHVFLLAKEAVEAMGEGQG